MGELRVVQEAPEGDTAQRRFPDLAMLRSELASALEQFASAGEVAFLLGRQGFALGDEREAELRVGIFPGGAEHLVGTGDVASLQRRKSLLLLLRGPPLRQDRKTALRVRIVAVRAEDALRFRGVAAIERRKARLERGGMLAPLDPPADLHVRRMCPLVGTQEWNRGVVRRQPEQRLAPGGRGVLAYRRIARHRGEHLDPFAARLLAIGEDLPQLELEAGLALRALDDLREAFPRPLPPSGDAGEHLVVLEREIAGRTRLAEQLRIFRGALRVLSLVHELASGDEHRSNPRPQRTSPRQHRHFRMLGIRLQEPRQIRTRLVEPPAPRRESAQRGERFGILRRNLENVLQASSALSLRARACQYQALRASGAAASCARAAEATSRMQISGRMATPRRGRAGHPPRSGIGLRRIHDRTT